MKKLIIALSNFATVSKNMKALQTVLTIHVAALSKA